MLPFQGYHGVSHQNKQIQQPAAYMMKTLDCGGLSSCSGSKSPNKESEQSSKKHAIAEQKRRERINRHFDTLRQLFPNLTKTDKATVLTETVRHVKELRKEATDYMTPLNDDESCCCGGRGPGSTSLFLPSENDEATVCYCVDGKSEGKVMKATICCEDRPGLNRELAQAIKSVQGKTMRAEMTTIGGRTKAVVMVAWQNTGGGDEGEDAVAGSLRRALRAVVENRTLGFSGLVDQLFPGAKWFGLTQEMPATKKLRICGL